MTCGDSIIVSDFVRVAVIYRIEQEKTYPGESLESVLSRCHRVRYERRNYNPWCAQPPSSPVMKSVSFYKERPYAGNEAQHSSRYATPTRPNMSLGNTWSRLQIAYGDISIVD